MKPKSRNCARAFVFLLCIFSLYFPRPGPSSAGESSVTLGEIEEHVRTLFADEKYIRKWVYEVNPVIIQTIDYGFDEKKQDAIDYVNRVIGMDVFRRSSGKVNFVVVITNKLSAVLLSPDIRPVFQAPDVSDEVYESRIADIGPDTATYSRIGIRDEALAIYGAVTVPQIRWQHHEEAHLLSLLVYGLSNVGESNIITPSIFNTHPNNVASVTTLSLPEVDRAFLQVLYSDQIRSGAATVDAVPKISQGMYEIMNR